MSVRRILLYFFSHRVLAIARWDLHFLRVRLWNALTSQKHRIRDFLSKREKPLFLNLGSGPRGIDDRHWVNVDGFRDQNVHYLIDFVRPLPFPDDSFDGVFSEHVMEHFSLADGEKLVREVHRILRLGGCFRVIVPDAEDILRSYFNAPNELVARRGVGNETPMEVVNLYFRQRYEHQFLYDWTALANLLSRSGFREVSRAAFGQGCYCATTILDDKKYQWKAFMLRL